MGCEVTPSDGRLPEIDVLSLRFVSHLGRGTYGTVQKAEYQNEMVAVKIVESERDSDRKNFINEMKLLCQLDHSNIVRVYGACSRRPRIALVMELMENGSVQDLLHSHMHLIYKADHAFSWGRQCADAISFMHARRLVHRDLKPPNLLLKDEYRIVKVCDFGTVSHVKTTMTNYKGSAAWMAPEVFSGQKYGEKCDVFSFGIMLWEMITRRMPYEDIEGAPPVVLWKTFSGARPPQIARCPPVLMDLISRCWNHDPNVRPSMREVFDVLTVFTSVFPDGRSLLVNKRKEVSSISFDQLETVPIPFNVESQLPPVTVVSNEGTGSRTYVNNSSRGATSGGRSPSSSFDQAGSFSPSPSGSVLRPYHNARLTSDSSSSGLTPSDEAPFSFLNRIEPHLRPIALDGEDGLYFEQMTACKDLDDVRMRLRQAAMMKHDRIAQLLQLEEFVKLHRKRNHLKEVLDQSTGRINSQRRSLPNAPD